MRGTHRGFHQEILGSRHDLFANESWSGFKVEGDTDIHDANFDADMTGQHIDPRATAQEVQDHLRSHRRGIGTYPFDRHTVISSKGEDCSLWDGWLHLPRHHDIARG